VAAGLWAAAARVGVTIVGLESGVELTFEGFRAYDAAPVQGAEGAHFVSVNFLRGVRIEHVHRRGDLAEAGRGAPLTMEKCTSGGLLQVGNGASLFMEECRVFGSDGCGVRCYGKLKATRCTIEDNAEHGACVRTRHAPLRGASKHLLTSLLHYFITWRTCIYIYIPILYTHELPRKRLNKSECMGRSI